MDPASSSNHGRHAAHLAPPSSPHPLFFLAGIFERRVIKRKFKNKTEGKLQCRVSFPKKLLYVLPILCQVAGLQSLSSEKFPFKVTVFTARASSTIPQGEAVLPKCPLYSSKHLNPTLCRIPESCFSCSWFVFSFCFLRSRHTCVGVGLLSVVTWLQMQGEKEDLRAAACPPPPRRLLAASSGQQGQGREGCL